MIFRRRRRNRSSTVTHDHPTTTEEAPAPHPSPTDAALADISDRFAMQILVLAEQQRGHLDRLEHEEQDPETLKRLYEVDHAVAQMRRAARELRVLAEKDESRLDGHPTSVLDVIRMAASSIESYARIRIGAVPELAVLAYATDDMASLLAPLLDNATRYSPAVVDVSAHATESGGVVVRVVDTGIGLSEKQLGVLNAAMAGAVPPVNELTSSHTGFPVVHRLAQRHGVQVNFVGRPVHAPESSGGTTAVISLPAPLICELPPTTETLGEFGATPPPAAQAPQPQRPHVAPGPIGVDSAPPPEPPAPQRPPAGDLPRRDSRSLRTKQVGGSWSTRPLAAADGEPVDPSTSFAEDLDSFFGGGAAGGTDGEDSAAEDSQNSRGAP